MTVPGAVIAGQYEVVRTLGEGAMGAVVLARDQALDRAVALKFLKPAVSDLFDSDRRFQQEARLLSRLSHPNVVTIYSFGEDENGVRYIAMEYIEGHTLEPHIEQDFLLPLDDLAHVVDQIASALAEAHDRGVIHRDIKPGNILLTSVGADQRYAKVVDFGLAKASESAAEGFGSSAAVSTQERGLALGTPAYISPEQALGTQVDARADVYGLAALIVRLLTGSLLFPGAQGAAQMLIAHATKPPPPISELGKWRGFEPGSALERVLLRALEKRPAHRYHNISVFSTEFVEAIYALRRAAPVGVFSLTESAALSTVLPDDALEQTLVGTEAAPIVESTATWSQQAVLLVSLDRLWSRDEGLGADEALDVMATVAARLQQAVREAGGRTQGGLSDRFVGFFVRASGVCAAAEAAVDAALRIRQALVGLNRDPTMPDGLDPVFRVFVDVGSVVTGVTRAEGELDYGQLLVRAQRQVGQIEDGQIAVSNRAHRYVRGTFRYQGGAQASGARYVASKKTGFRLRDPEIEGQPIGLIGRDQELETLLHQTELFDLERVSTSAVVLSGVAGVGKTRLVGEMLRTLDERERTIWLEAGRCSAHEEAGPYEPFAEALRQRTRVLAADDASTIRLKARNFIGQRLGLEDSERSEAIESTLVGLLSGRLTEESVQGEAAQRGQLFEHLAAVYQAMAAVQPLLILIDDFHYASAATRDLLAYLSGRLQEHTVLFVVLVREEGRELAMSTLQREGIEVLDMVFSEMDKTASTALVEHLLAPAKEVPTGLVHRITDLSQGLPLVAEETVRDLIDNGIIETHGDYWAFTQMSLGEIQLPDTVDALFEGRITRLPENQQLILEAAAIAGRRFWPAMLGHVLSERWSPADLAELESKGFVKPLGQTVLGAESDFGFVQRAMRDAIYKRIQPDDRKKVHLAIAKWLQGQTGVANLQIEGVIGRHYRLGGEPALAFPCLLLAAHRAMSATALEESIAYLEACREMLPLISHADMGASKRHLAGMKVLSDLVHQYVVVGELQKALDASRDAEGYTADDAGPAQDRRDRITLDRARALFLMGRFDEAKEAFGTLVVEGSVEGAALDAASGFAGAVAKLGDIEGAISMLTVALDTYTGADSNDDRGGIHKSRAYRTLGNCALEAQRFDLAESHLSRALEFAAVARAPELTVEALNSTAALHFFRGDATGAVEGFRKALEVAEQWDFTQHRTMLLQNLGEAVWKEGGIEESVEMLERAETLARYVGMDGVLAESLRIRAEIQFDGGHYESAEPLARRALDAANVTGAPRFQAPAQLILARVTRAREAAAGQEPTAEVSASFERAAQFFERCGLEEKAAAIREDLRAQ